MSSYKEMIDDIKKLLKKNGFEEKGKTAEGVLIFKKRENSNKKQKGNNRLK